MVGKEGREVSQRKNTVLRLLSQAWLAYSESYPDGRNFEEVLQAICQAQLAVFDEDD